MNGTNDTRASVAPPRQVGDVSIVCLQGCVDAASLRFLEVNLLSHAESPDAKIAVDLRHVESMDSSGLGMLLALTKKARTNGGDVVLFGLPSCVEPVFRVTGMVRIVRVFDEEAQAVSHFG